MKRDNKFKDGLMICICLNLPSLLLSCSLNPNEPSIQRQTNNKVVLAFTFLGAWWIHENLIFNIQNFNRDNNWKAGDENLNADFFVAE